MGTVSRPFITSLCVVTQAVVVFQGYSDPKAAGSVE